MSNFHQYGKGDATHNSENQQYASLVEQLDLMIRARYPLLYVISVEEEPVEEVLLQVASRSVPKRQLLFWDIVRGWSDNGADKGSVMAALGRIGKADAQTPAMFVLRDLHPFVKNPTTEKNAPIVRELRNLTRELKRSRQIIITTSHTLELPDELLQEVTVVDFPLPSVGEIDNLIQHLMDYQKKEIEIKNLDHLGIVAGLIDEIGIVETINSKLGIDGREKISSGTVVKAILINGLGFVSRPLYLFSQFFEDKKRSWKIYFSN